MDFMFQGLGKNKDVYSKESQTRVVSINNSKGNQTVYYNETSQRQLPLSEDFRRTVSKFGLN